MPLINIKFLIFTLSDEEYGLDISCVQEVIRVPKFFPVPEAADFVEGVMIFRGKVVTLINLRKKMGLPSKTISDTDRIIITLVKDHPVGIIVDLVSGVFDVESASISNPDDSLRNATYLKGIAKVGPRLIMITDLNNLFSSENIASLKSVKNKVELRQRA